MIGPNLSSRGLGAGAGLHPHHPARQPSLKDASVAGGHPVPQRGAVFAAAKRGRRESPPLTPRTATACFPGPFHTP